MRRQLGEPGFAIIVMLLAKEIENCYNLFRSLWVSLLGFSALRHMNPYRYVDRIMTASDDNPYDK